jgi:hypothetical protein
MQLPIQSRPVQRTLLGGGPAPAVFSMTRNAAPAWSSTYGIETTGGVTPQVLHICHNFISCCIAAGGDVLCGGGRCFCV